MLLAEIYPWIVPLWIVAVGVVGAVALLFALVFAADWLVPRFSAVMRTTAKECWSQPLFPAVTALGLVLVLLSVFLPYGTLGDDIKMMKDTGLMMILVLSILLAVLSAALTVSDEIEGRTALTVLSKPITRRQFVVGKLSGVLFTLALFYIVLGAFYLSAVSYKLKFEARENSLPDPTSLQCQVEMLRTIPALVLAFFETVVMTTVGVALSTRLAMIPNLLICATVYVVGHMTPLIVQSSIGKLPIVAFVGQFFSTVFPVLEHFNIQAAVASGHDAVMTIPQWLTYLSWAGLYCFLYSAIMLLVSLLMFEDRDMA